MSIWRHHDVEMFIYHSLKSVRPCEIIVLCCATTELDGLQCSGYLYLCVPCLMCRKLLNHNGGHDKYSYLSIETDYRLPDLLLHLTRSRDRHSADTDTLQLGDTPLHYKLGLGTSIDTNNDRVTTLCWHASRQSTFPIRYCEYIIDVVMLDVLLWAGVCRARLGAWRQTGVLARPSVKSQVWGSEVFSVPPHYADWAAAAATSSAYN